MMITVKMSKNIYLRREISKKLTSKQRSRDLIRREFVTTILIGRYEISFLYVIKMAETVRWSQGVIYSAFGMICHG